MTDVTTDIDWRETAETAQPKRAPRSGWVLMGDIATHRAGVSEHLIQWRRRMGKDDPEPML